MYSKTTLKVLEFNLVFPMKMDKNHGMWFKNTVVQLAVSPYCPQMCPD